MTMEYSFEKIAYDETARSMFFEQYDVLIKNLIKSGYVDCAIHHANNKKRIKEGVDLICETLH
ncbi:hypothetical protein SAMN03159422_02412 [Agrobacterium fabrum]|uniref:hypothetical protein n=1 Tax=Agrobacterium fabrum TaxID=1176649 RepID=UPI00088B3E62|nr:hypothetical protein [Agrobacterium fabrum]MDH6295324.1 hypothetical protein [Agrobacterium fabrum]SDB60950.1 hypothetical protein SAMN03159422_02412 [Agrobacterium fabrum]SER30830.1 hypothetical protein SAMN03159504_02638 [Agrobacterium fabrum]